ncbi:MAG: MBL fold metallo-hydrolase [Myxococcota bacterium]
MQVTILGSGSEGNALLLESETTSVVVDAGISHRRLVARIRSLGRELPRVSAIIVTHGHTDHAAHASVYASRFGCPIYATKPTQRALRVKSSTEVRTLTVGRRLRLGGITVVSRSVPHDAPQVALRLESATTSVGLVTDLGHVPSDLARFLDSCDTLLLESNHDEDMLDQGPYPLPLKRRVGGSHGHLSNAQAGDLLASLSSTPARVVLMHLSETNNTERLARASAEAALGHRGTELRVARPREALALPFMGSRQLRLSL